LYFTSGTTSRPKLVEHTQVSYPVGHLATAFWIAAQPGDVHLNISSPGWAKHAWSCFFAPWIAEATIFIYNYSRFDAAALLRQIRRAGVNTFCAPPTVWRMLINANLSDGPGALRELMPAGEPLNPRGDRAGPGAVGTVHPGRLRADRTAFRRRQRSRHADQTRLDGAPATGGADRAGGSGHRRTGRRRGGG
jgi:acyl-CoA synthetase (AMP-forming)/AMP-acid ligase II